MKARGGFTLVELLLAGAILATISFGALIGTMRISKMVNDRSQLMAADGYCWDVAWALFNTDYEQLRDPIEQAKAQGFHGCEISGNVWHSGNPNPDRPEYKFLSQLQSPVCYVTLSNAVDSAGKEVESGLCISVNLEWGPPGQRSILMPRANHDVSEMKMVYNHPVQVFKSHFGRSGK